MSMRALLLFNPNATTTDSRVRDVIAAALGSAVDLEVLPTKQRGHATHLVAGALHEGVDAVFALGGDGTANEVLQALAGTDVLLGIVPGGGTNVFARALGLPNDPVQATSVMLEALRAGRSRSITIGRAGDRYFGFNAGFGFDAAVIRHVEQHDSAKRWLRQGAFLWSATSEWFGGAGREDPSTTLTLPGGVTDGPLALSLIANTDPYTYLGPRPMRVHPESSFDDGLDLLTVAKASTVKFFTIVAGAFRDGAHLRQEGVRYHRDLAGFTLSAPTPQPLMVDGDYAGEHAAVTFAAVPNALRVLV